MFNRSRFNRQPFNIALFVDQNIFANDVIAVSIADTPLHSTAEFSAIDSSTIGTIIAPLDIVSDVQSADNLTSLISDSVTEISMSSADITAVTIAQDQSLLCAIETVETLILGLTEQEPVVLSNSTDDIALSFAKTSTCQSSINTDDWSTIGASTVFGVLISVTDTNDITIIDNMATMTAEIGSTDEFLFSVGKSTASDKNIVSTDEFNVVLSILLGTTTELSSEDSHTISLVFGFSDASVNTITNDIFNLFLADNIEIISIVSTDSSILSVATNQFLSQSTNSFDSISLSAGQDSSVFLGSTDDIPLSSSESNILQFSSNAEDAMLIGLSEQAPSIMFGSTDDNILSFLEINTVQVASDTGDWLSLALEIQSVISVDTSPSDISNITIFDNFLSMVAEILSTDNLLLSADKNTTSDKFISSPDGFNLLSEESLNKTTEILSTDSFAIAISFGISDIASTTGSSDFLLPLSLESTWTVTVLSQDSFAATFAQDQSASSETNSSDTTILVLIVPEPLIVFNTADNIFLLLSEINVWQSDSSAMDNLLIFVDDQAMSVSSNIGAADSSEISLTDSVILIATDIVSLDTLSIRTNRVADPYNTGKQYNSRSNYDTEHDEVSIISPSFSASDEITLSTVENTISTKSIISTDILETIIITGIHSVSSEIAVNDIISLSTIENTLSTNIVSVDIGTLTLSQDQFLSHEINISDSILLSSHEQEPTVTFDSSDNITLSLVEISDWQSSSITEDWLSIGADASVSLGATVSSSDANDIALNDISAPIVIEISSLDSFVLLIDKHSSSDKLIATTDECNIIETISLDQSVDVLVIDALIAEIAYNPSIMMADIVADLTPNLSTVENIETINISTADSLNVVLADNQSLSYVSDSFDLVFISVSEQDVLTAIGSSDNIILTSEETSVGQSNIANEDLAPIALDIQILLAIDMAISDTIETSIIDNITSIATEISSLDNISLSIGKSITDTNFIEAIDEIAISVTTFLNHVVELLSGDFCTTEILDVVQEIASSTENHDNTSLSLSETSICQFSSNAEDEFSLNLDTQITAHVSMSVPELNVLSISDGILSGNNETSSIDDIFFHTDRLLSTYNKDNQYNFGTIYNTDRGETSEVAPSFVASDSILLLVDENIVSTKFIESIDILEIATATSLDDITTDTVSVDIIMLVLLEDSVAIAVPTSDALTVILLEDQSISHSVSSIDTSSLSLSEQESIIAFGSVDVAILSLAETCDWQSSSDTEDWIDTTVSAETAVSTMTFTSEANDIAIICSTMPIAADIASIDSVFILVDKHTSDTNILSSSDELTLSVVTLISNTVEQSTTDLSAISIIANLFGTATEITFSDIFTLFTVEDIVSNHIVSVDSLMMSTLEDRFVQCDADGIDDILLSLQEQELVAVFDSNEIITLSFSETNILQSSSNSEDSLATTLDEQVSLGSNVSALDIGEIIALDNVLLISTDILSLDNVSIAIGKNTSEENTIVAIDEIGVLFGEISGKAVQIAAEAFFSAGITSGILGNTANAESNENIISSLSESGTWHFESNAEDSVSIIFDAQVVQSANTATSDSAGIAISDNAIMISAEISSVNNASIRTDRFVSQYNTVRQYNSGLAYNTDLGEKSEITPVFVGLDEIILFVGEDLNSAKDIVSSDWLNIALTTDILISTQSNDVLLAGIIDDPQLIALNSSDSCVFSGVMQLLIEVEAYSIDWFLLYLDQQHLRGINCHVELTSVLLHLKALSPSIAATRQIAKIDPDGALHITGYALTGSDRLAITPEGNLHTNKILLRRNLALTSDNTLELPRLIELYKP